MILSNLSIQEALDDRRLVIDPEPSPRRPEPGGGYCPYDTHSVDLRLHNEISVPEGGSFAYNFAAEGNIAEEISKHSRKLTLSKEQPYQMKPLTFVLARTLEKIELPIGKKPYLAARIEGKSSRARCGILVHFTAPTVHPGFKGSLTLEMINLGPADFMLFPGMPIAQLIVEQVIGDLIETPSQFQGQSTPDGLE